MSIKKNSLRFVLRSKRIAGWLLLGLVFVLSSCVTTSSIEEISSEYYNIGNAYFKLGDYAKAIKYYEKAYRLNPELSESRYNLSLAYMKVGRFSAAEKILEVLLEKDPSNIKILNALAYNFYLKGDDAESLKIFEKILEEYPESRDARNNVAIIYWKEGKVEKAIREFKILLRYYPDDLITKFNLGKILIENKMYKEGVQYIQDYAELKPDDYEAFLVMGYGYEGMENYKKALDAFSYAISVNNKLKTAWFESAFILLTKVEDPERGKADLKRALELGFKDRKKLMLLLNAKNLMDREDVLKLLKDNGIELGESAISKAEPPKGEIKGRTNPGHGSVLTEPKSSGVK